MQHLQHLQRKTEKLSSQAQSEVLAQSEQWPGPARVFRSIGMVEQETD
jgi:hypothetical protein